MEKNYEDPKARIRERNRKYRSTHKMKIKEYNKRYYSKNKTKLKIKAIKRESER